MTTSVAAQSTQSKSGGGIWSLTARAAVTFKRDKFTGANSTAN
jgi:hypothetical protein